MTPNLCDAGDLHCFVEIIPFPIRFRTIPCNAGNNLEAKAIVLKAAHLLFYIPDLPYVPYLSEKS